MQVHKNYFYIPILLLFTAYIGTMAYEAQWLFLPQIVGSLASLFFLGYFFLDAFKITFSSLTEKVFHSTALSIFFLYVIGLFINWTLPLLGNSTPLTAFPIQLAFTLCFYTLFVTSYLRKENMLILPHINKLSLVLIIIALLFPIASIAGANRLNNGYSNIVTLITLCVIPIYLCVLTMLSKKLSHAVFPISLGAIAMTVLLMLSLRSWYILGYDISSEYQVFQFTKNLGYWTIDTYRNAYNACMSITILPTLLSYITKFSDGYVLKFLFAAMFSITPVVIYFYVRRISNLALGYLSGFFFIIQPWFIDPMVTIGRQEIAFIFFIILVATLFEQKIKPLHKHLLISFYIIGLVLSHYSTTYISNVLFMGSFGILVISYLIGKFFPTRFKKLIFIKERFLHGNYNLHILHVVLLFLMTFLWYSQLTGTASNIGDFLRKTQQSLNSMFTNEQRAGILDQVALKDKPVLREDVYVAYYKQKTLEYANKKDVSLFKDPEYANYKLIPRKTQELPIANEKLYQITNSIYKLSLGSIQLFIALGALILAVYEFWKNKKIPVDYVAFSMISALLLVAIIVIPNFSLNYNFDRLYLQAMFFLGFLEVLAAYRIYQLLSFKKLGFQLATVHYLVVFLFTFSIIWQFVGGKTNVWLNNMGLAYDLTYTHKEETLAADWIGNHYDFNTVYVDGPGRNKLAAYGLLNNVNYDFFPSIIGRGSYVFLTYSNVQDRLSYFYYRGVNVAYEVPFPFLNKNKNKVYDNGGSVVYK